LTKATLEQAIAALAGGRPVRIGGLAYLSIETADNATLAVLDPDGWAALIIGAERAAALGLSNERAVVPGQPVRIGRCDWLDRDMVRALADAGRDFDRLIPGPLAVSASDEPRAAAAALRLARLAGLLPGLWEISQPDGALEIDAATIMEPSQMTIAARARLPIADVGEGQIVVFRESGTGDEHVALMLGERVGEPPLVRVHSECLTGDVFASLKCDCGPQLRAALALIAADGGILLYLRQEGRGIGLANKIRAYALQDRGLDTVEANRRLGFADDERDFAVAARMLDALGVDTVRLLTNNPAKVEGLKRAGVTVIERVAHHMPTNPHNADYIATKKAKSGHLD
jgi:GTP cyclohydrolase II